MIGYGLEYEMVCPHPCTCGKNELCTGQSDYIIIIMNKCTCVHVLTSIKKQLFCIVYKSDLAMSV